MNSLFRSTPLTGAILLAAFALAGCDSVVDGSNARANTVHRAFTDALDTWSEVFTYHGKPQPQLPQTRYCYKMMSDIVCYDSLQPTLTAKLVGYQDGTHMSWVQPGGGSLGASGSQPVSWQAAEAKSTFRNVSAVRKPLESQAIEVPKTGEIQTIDTPPAVR